MKKTADAPRPKVLIVDDPFRTLHPLLRSISPEAFSPIWVPGEQDALKLLSKEPQEEWVIIIDLKSSRMGGGGFLQKARQVAPRAAILVTGPLGLFLYKQRMFYEFTGPTLAKEINSVLREIVRGPEEKEKPPQQVPSRFRRRQLRDRFGRLIGCSQSMNEIYELIEHVKDSAATVLIQGESGTGKELIARTIHQTSRRKDQPFVAINCGAIPHHLVESELFGHERGAFTGAVALKKGKFEAAHRGTLFLDEIGELNRDLQVKLLRVLQEREFQRVGGNHTIKTDVRIIAATSADLRHNVATGEFREDLFYRLNVLPIRVPSLRERKEDIPLLLNHFFRRRARDLDRALPDLSEDASTALVNYSYPGNVRELANLVERLLVTCPDGHITFADLPEEVREEAYQQGNCEECLRELPEEGVSLREVERELIIKTLEKTAGNKRAAARMLGITRRLLYLRLAQYGLN